ncbi:unnamed protein product [Clavelina lepadiformis]|uniref:Cysteine/serine-rich nuclear protein N-terminal domain-containing protein n=1 Tax=Clavelina lepadiformis TaxID=159417 RepID=A0ABP0F6K3_CLALP
MDTGSKDQANQGSAENSKITTNDNCHLDKVLFERKQKESSKNLSPNQALVDAHDEKYFAKLPVHHHCALDSSSVDLLKLNPASSEKLQSAEKLQPFFKDNKIQDVCKLSNSASEILACANKTQSSSQVNEFQGYIPESTLYSTESNQVTEQDILNNISFSNQSQSNDMLAIDESTTQLRLFTSSLDNSFCLENEKSSYANSMGNSQSKHHHTEFDLYNEISYYLPNEEQAELLDADSASLLSVSSESCLDTKEATMRALSLVPTSSEDCSVDSGVISLDEQPPLAVAPSATNESSSNTKDGRMQSEAVTRLLSESPDKLVNRTETTKKRPFTGLTESEVGMISKRRKSSRSKIVSFKGVTVYFFPRKQSFITVPSQGGSTLGMSLKHNHSVQMTLNQHKCAIARRRKAAIKKHKHQQRIDAKVKQLKQRYPSMESAHLMSMVMEVEPPLQDSPDSSSSEEYYENDLCNEDHKHEEVDDDYFFLQPISTKKRRLMLKIAGVQRIDSEEKLSNKLTRESREVCGCECEGVCNPATCHCAQMGIPCQVDRESFPCSCAVSGCYNPRGRVEFDVDRVRNHYIRTMRRLRLEETGAEAQTGVSPTITSPQPSKSPYVSCVEDDNNNNNNVENYVKTDEQGLEDPSPSSFVPCSPPGSTGSFSNPLYSWAPNCHESYVLQPLTNATSFAQSPAESLPSSGCSFTPNKSHADASSCNLLAQTSTTNQVISEQNGFQYFLPQPVATSCAMVSTLSYPCKSYQSVTSAGVHCTQSRYGATISKISTTSSDNNQDGFEPPLKLDPIASFFPVNGSSGRCLSQEVVHPYGSFHSCNKLEVLGQPLSQISPTSYNVGYGSRSNLYECGSDAPEPRSRSSSLSECGHDVSIDVKA